MRTCCYVSICKLLEVGSIVCMYVCVGSHVCVYVCVFVYILEGERWNTKTRSYNYNSILFPWKNTSAFNFVLFWQLGGKVNLRSTKITFSLRNGEYDGCWTKAYYSYFQIPFTDMRTDSSDFPLLLIFEFIPPYSTGSLSKLLPKYTFFLHRANLTIQNNKKYKIIMQILVI